MVAALSAGAALLIVDLACVSPTPPPTPTPMTSKVEHEAAGAPPEANEGAAKRNPQGAREVHGTLRTVDGQRVLQVWGSPFEMGYAHGYLLRDAILAVVDGYALEAIPPEVFTTAGPLFATRAEISLDRREEAEGVIAGMIAAGGATSAGLARDLSPSDLLLVNAMTDLVAIGCSSLSAWGPATAGDPRLAGELAIVRNLDWSANPALLESQVIIAYAPADPSRQPVVSVAFAGYLGCLSCINEAGVAALFNMGYGDGAASLAEATAGFAPANLLLRDALAARDLDGDGESTATELHHALTAPGRRHAGSYIVHVVEPAAKAAAAGRPPAQVLEVEATGVASRSAEPGSRLGATALAATNHLRATAKPAACSRYRRLEAAVQATPEALELPRLWALGEAVRLDADVVHTLLLIPSERSLKIRLRAPGRAMDASPPAIEHRWADLFRGIPAQALD